MSERINEGYVITQSIKVGDTEFVFGENQSDGTYMTWACKNGTDYYWGHYSNNRFAALKDLCMRAANEIDYLSSNKRIKPTKSVISKDYER